MGEMKPWGYAAFVGSAAPGKVIKLGRDEQDAALAVARLKQLGDVGALEVKAQFAALLAESAQAEHQLAQLVRSNGWLVSAQQPVRRWPVYVLSSLIGLMLALQVAMFYRAQHPTPPLSIAPKTEEGPKVAQRQKGRVER